MDGDVVVGDVMDGTWWTGWRLAPGCSPLTTDATVLQYQVRDSSRCFNSATKFVTGRPNPTTYGKRLKTIPPYENE